MAVTVVPCVIVAYALDIADDPNFVKLTFDLIGEFYRARG